MKKILIFLAVFVFANQGFAQNAHRSGFYVGIYGGLSFFQDSKTSIFRDKVPVNISLDRGFTGGAAVGYDFGRYFRSEFEFNYRKTDMDRWNSILLGHTYSYKLDGSVRTLSYMANGYLQYPITDAVVPYIGIGVGMASVKMDKPCIHHCSGNSMSRNLLAYQGIVGLGVNLSDHVTMSVDYRYFTTKEGRFETDLHHVKDIKTRISSHNVMIGVRYKF